MNRRDARALYEISAVAMHDAVLELAGVMRSVIEEALDDRDAQQTDYVLHIGKVDRELDDLRGQIAQAMNDLAAAEASVAVLTERAEAAERDYRLARMGQETAQRDADGLALLKEAAEERVKALSEQADGLRQLLDEERALGAKLEGDLDRLGDETIALREELRSAKLNLAEAKLDEDESQKLINDLLGDLAAKNGPPLGQPQTCAARPQTHPLPPPPLGLTETAALIQKLAQQGRDDEAIGRIVNARREPVNYVSRAGIVAIREMLRC